jgi:hypothetical protein
VNINEERYEASMNCAKLCHDGMISSDTKDRIIQEIAQTTGCAYFDISIEVERLITMFAEGDLT